MGTRFEFSSAWEREEREAPEPKSPKSLSKVLLGLTALRSKQTEKARKFKVLRTLADHSLGLFGPRAPRRLRQDFLGLILAPPSPRQRAPQDQITLESFFLRSGGCLGASGHLRLRPLSKCSKSRDLTAIVICDSNRESQITSDLRQCDLIRKAHCSDS